MQIAIYGNDTMTGASPFLLNGVVNLKGLGAFNRVIEKGFEKTTRLSQLHQLYTQLPASGNGKEFLQHALKSLGVRYQFNEDELKHIPEQGPAVIVANHPFGGLEGMIMADLLLSIRSDVKIIANPLLSRITDIADLLIDVDPFGGKTAVKRNHKPIKAAFDWVKRGGLLVVFPAGEVSSLQIRKRMITDPEWKSLIARIVKRVRIPVIPIRFEGKNSNLFQLAGLMHPRLRTLMLPHEILNKREKVIRLRIGKAIRYETMEAMDNEEIVRYLRLQTYLLGSGNSPANKVIKKNQDFRAWDLPVADPQPAELLARQIRDLSANQLLISAGEMQVYIADAGQIPDILQEIGRLREITFRAVGEGTGKAVDLDYYDSYYQHLFIWDQNAELIVGAYRIGKTDEILNKFGKKGLYSHSLFKFKNDLFEKINPALELGRSFVRREYQKNYAPLLLLWRGIGQFVARNPGYHRLFGAVSISDEYTPASQQVLINFLRVNRFDHELSAYVKPRRKFRYKGERSWLISGASGITDLESLSDLIGRIEGDQKGIPILLKQYLKLGGRLLGFNIDDQFNNVLDGLIVVDLREADLKVLSRYMSKDSAVEFLANHRAQRAA